MIINTDYYGSIEYKQEELVTFPDGILGFPDLKEYLPLGLDEGDGSLLLLQSVEDPKIAFFLINPPALLADYNPVLQPEELSFLEAKDSSELSYYSICIVNGNYLDNIVNLKCPLVINPVTRKGIQVVLSGTEYGYRHSLRSILKIENSEGGDKDVSSET